MFDFDSAFSRNIGLISVQEQQQLRQKTVAIAGMGGVGGDYLISLIRAGVCNFHIADFDTFEIQNFNRQYGATLSTLDQSKAQTMAAMAKDINPEANIKIFEAPVSEDNIDDFLSSIDLVVNGIDLFVPDAHRLIINASIEKGLTVISALPSGYGAGMVIFDSNSMSFEDYFDYEKSTSNVEKVIQLALGYSPAAYHIKYIDPKSIDLANAKGPSSIAGIRLCSAMVTTQVVDKLLEHGQLKTAPWFTHIDLKRFKFKHSYLFFGNRNPLQRLKKIIALSRISAE
jgi:molybdopterin/thiamine biosynthesis adenylyltransferase